MLGFVRHYYEYRFFLVHFCDRCKWMRLGLTDVCRFLRRTALPEPKGRGAPWVASLGRITALVDGTSKTCTGPNRPP